FHPRLIFLTRNDRLDSVYEIPEINNQTGFFFSFILKFKISEVSDQTNHKAVREDRWCVSESREMVLQK
uniref:Uncharacterized protein n=1 Tax=Amphimedon queenslandica TaxID=400682 RepID=A0A1X7UWT6_AMPQE